MTIAGNFFQQIVAFGKMGKRVCIIGAGPSGMCLLYQFNRLKKEGKEIPEIVCFEKSAEWGGLWNYTWRTGESKHC